MPFRRFRHRLVDRLLDLLDKSPDYRAFTLDGQTILLDDYLEIRPDQEARLRRLIEEERLLIGPWYTLPDLFLVSGEAILRNLQIGHDRCDEFGGGMPVGYIPDPLGHIAQMPQILRGFGLDTYIFMRGLGRREEERLGESFDWEAPDGSAIYQPKGYFPAAALGHPDIFGRFDGHAPEIDLAAEQVRDYAFEHFSDPEYGEWFGYLDRPGHVTHECKGAPYKGRFHVPRGLFLCWRLLKTLENRPDKDPR